MSDWYLVIAKGVVAHVRVTPHASGDAIGGVHIRDDGQAVLKIRVKAVPDKGQANKAVITLMAKSLGVAKSDIRILRGAAARQKQLAISGNPADLVAKLTHIAAETQ